MTSKGKLCMAPEKYIDRLVNSFVNMFGVKPKPTVNLPLE